MFNAKHSSKIKNDKIMRWRLELACYNFDIQYRPGDMNVVASTFSRNVCSVISCDTLAELRNSLCHPGITRMAHFVRSKNLPFSVEDVKKIINRCQICAVNKPRFYKPPDTNLVKATQPFERLSIDFKGPVPSSTRNRYILTIVDEYSGFPFAFPCSDVTTATVVQCLSQFFAISGTPFIHSDRGAAFMPSEFKLFCLNNGIS